MKLIGVATSMAALMMIAVAGLANAQERPLPDTISG